LPPSPIPSPGKKEMCINRRQTCLDCQLNQIDSNPITIKSEKGEKMYDCYQPF
jgi:hypothetical protein